MHNNQNAARTLYKTLLAFYPRAFRAQFGESMVQSFTERLNRGFKDLTPIAVETPEVATAISQTPPCNPY